MEPHDTTARLEEMERNIESLVAMVSELYEKTHQVERILIQEGTLDIAPPAIDEHGPEGLFAAAKDYVTRSGRCSVSLLQKEFKISYQRAFALLDALEAAGVIAPYRGEVERVVNQ